MRLLIFFVLLLTSIPLAAETHTVRLFDYTPFMVSQEGQHRGAVVSLLRAIFKDLPPDTIRLESSSMTRNLTDFKSEKISCMIFDQTNADYYFQSYSKANFFRIAAALYARSNDLGCKGNNDTDVSKIDLSCIKGKTVAVKRNSNATVRVIEALGGEAILVDNLRQGFKLLELKRVDYLSSLELSVSNLQKETKLTLFKKVGRIFELKAGLYCNAKGKFLANHARKKVETWKKKRVIEDIIKSYLASSKEKICREELFYAFEIIN